jgi:hypothetical protein
VLGTRNVAFTLDVVAGQTTIVLDQGSPVTLDLAFSTTVGGMPVVRSGMIDPAHAMLGLDNVLVVVE